jgi:large subunit ribosomal protein L20
MARVKRGVTSRAKHKKVLKAVKGQWGRRKKHYKSCKASNGKGYAICIPR